MHLKEIFEKAKSVSVTELSDNRVAISINRKSRFIRKDAEKLIEKIKLSDVAVSNITLEINAPLCSKAERFLSSNNIIIQKKV